MSPFCYHIFMSKKKLLALIIIILFIFCVITTVIFFLIKRRIGIWELVSQHPIKGSDVGEGGNDMDNTFRSLTISPTDPDIVYIGSEGNGIFRTLDGGETWEWLRIGLKHFENHYPEIYDIAIDENNEDIVLAATTNGPSPIYSDKYDMPVTAGIYISENSGDSWTQYLSGLPNSAITSLAQIPSESGTFVIGLDGQESSRSNFSNMENFGGIYISRDGGKTWSALPIPEEGVKNRYPRLKVRGGDEPVMYTTGVRWKNMEGTFHSQPDIEESVGLLRGDDMGQTWNKINPGDAFILYFDVSADGNTIYTSSFEEGEMYMSDNRGENWRVIGNQGTGPIKICPDDAYKVIYGSGRDLFLTADQFRTTKKVLTLSQGVNDIEYFKGNSDIVYVSGSGLEVYKSVDGGETFEKVGDLRKFIDEYE